MDMFYYRLLNFGRRNRGYGFGVDLSPEYARLAASVKMSKTAEKEFQREGWRIIHGNGIFDRGSIEHPYGFWKNTWLLRACAVPGAECDLGADDIERLLEIDPKNESKYLTLTYYPHNVDNAKQAFSLLGIWLNWADQLARLKAKR